MTKRISIYLFLKNSAILNNEYSFSNPLSYTQNCIQIAPIFSFLCIISLFWPQSQILFVHNNRVSYPHILSNISMPVTLLRSIIFFQNTFPFNFLKIFSSYFTAFMFCFCGFSFLVFSLSLWFCFHTSWDKCSYYLQFCSPLDNFIIIFCYNTKASPSASRPTNQPASYPSIQPTSHQQQ